MSSSWEHGVGPGGVVWMEPDGDNIQVWAEMPTAGATSLEDALRGASWSTIQVPRNEEAAFVKHARAGNLGAPLTPEFDITYQERRYRVQGFTCAILFAEVGPDGAWIAGDDVQEVAW